MPSPMKLEKKRSAVTSTSTSSSARTVSYEKFLIEKNCKNEAYAFILSQGLFQQFQDYHFSHHSDDPHKDCLKFLLSNI